MGGPVEQEGWRRFGHRVRYIYVSGSLLRAMMVLVERPSSSCSLPPLKCWRGTNPSQAANWRPDRNAFASRMVAAGAVAVMTPMPGMVPSSRLVGPLANGP